MKEMASAVAQFLNSLAKTSKIQALEVMVESFSHAVIVPAVFPLAFDNRACGGYSPVWWYTFISLIYGLIAQFIFRYIIMQSRFILSKHHVKYLEIHMILQHLAFLFFGFFVLPGCDELEGSWLLFFARLQLYGIDMVNVVICSLNMIINPEGLSTKIVNAQIVRHQERQKRFEVQQRLEEQNEALL